MSIKTEIQTLIDNYINKDGGRNSILVEEVNELLTAINEGMRAGDEPITHNSTTELNAGDYQHLTVAEKAMLVTEINTETISATKTLLATDKRIQIITLNAANRTINLPATTTVGKEFIIINNEIYNSTLGLTVNYTGFPVGYTPGGGNWVINPANGVHFIYSSAGWILINQFAVSGFGFVFGNARSAGGIGLGWQADAGVGVAIGSNSKAGFVAIGAGSKAGSQTINIAGTDLSAKSNCVAIGSGALSESAAVAIGGGANAKKVMSVAIGRASIAERFNEFAKDFSTTAKRNFLLEGAQYITTDATPRTLTLHYDNSSTELISLFASSMISFDFILNALDSLALGFKSWKIQGTIIRGATGNVSLLAAVTPVVIAETGVYNTSFNTNNWLVSATADTTNNSLKIQITGEASKTINWFLTGWANENRI